MLWKQDHCSGPDNKNGHTETPFPVCPFTTTPIPPPPSPLPPSIRDTGLSSVTAITIRYDAGSLLGSFSVFVIYTEHFRIQSEMLSDFNFTWMLKTRRHVRPSSQSKLSKPSMLPFSILHLLPFRWKLIFNFDLQECIKTHLGIYTVHFRCFFCVFIHTGSHRSIYVSASGFCLCHFGGKKMGLCSSPPPPATPPHLPSRRHTSTCSQPSLHGALRTSVGGVSARAPH